MAAWVEEFDNHQLHATLKELDEKINQEFKTVTTTFSDLTEEIISQKQRLDTASLVTKSSTTVFQSPEQPNWIAGLNTSLTRHYRIGESFSDLFNCRFDVGSFGLLHVSLQRNYPGHRHLRRYFVQIRFELKSAA
jgi:hypothetical protein